MKATGNHLMNYSLKKLSMQKRALEQIDIPSNRRMNSSLERINQGQGTWSKATRSVIWTSTNNRSFAIPGKWTMTLWWSTARASLDTSHGLSVFCFFNKLCWGKNKAPTKEERIKRKAKRRERLDQVYWSWIWKVASWKIQKSKKKDIQQF